MEGVVARRCADRRATLPSAALLPAADERRHDLDGLLHAASAAIRRSEEAMVSLHHRTERNDKKSIRGLRYGVVDREPKSYSLGPAVRARCCTKNIDHPFDAFNELEIAEVVINDVLGFRVDHMPYGRVKDSGFGREGVRFAMEEMTEIRLMVMKNPGGV